METYELYNGEVILKYDDNKHRYTVEGEVITGVTSVTGIIDKPAIKWWAINETLGFLKKVLKPGVVYDEIQIETMLKDAKYAHRRSLGKAGDIGSLVHDAIEIYIKTGKITKLIHIKAKRCFDLFLDWQKEEGVEFIDSERRVYSRKHNYAGTLDFTCLIGGKLYLGDTKTSSGIWNEYWFQVAGYQQAFEEEFGKKVKGQVIVRVGKDGSFDAQKRTVKDYKKNVIAFNSALALSRRLKELKE